MDIIQLYYINFNNGVISSIIAAGIVGLIQQIIRINNKKKKLLLIIVLFLIILPIINITMERKKPDGSIIVTEELIGSIATFVGEKVVSTINKHEKEKKESEKKAAYEAEQKRKEIEEAKKGGDRTRREQEVKPISQQLEKTDQVAVKYREREKQVEQKQKETKINDQQRNSKNPSDGFMPAGSIVSQQKTKEQQVKLDNKFVDDKKLTPEEIDDEFIFGSH